MRSFVVLLATLSLAACSKRPPPGPSPSPRPVTYHAAYAAYEDGTLVACVDETSSSPLPDAREGLTTIPSCGALGRRDVATCTLPGKTVRYFSEVAEDDVEARDCVTSGGKWKLDERELARVRLQKNRKKLQGIADRLAN